MESCIFVETIMAKSKDLIDILDTEKKSEETKLLKVEYNPNQQAIQNTLSELEYLNWLIPHLEQRIWKKINWCGKNSVCYHTTFCTINYRLEKTITLSNGCDIENYLLTEYIEDASLGPYTGDMIIGLFEKIEKK